MIMHVQLIKARLEHQHQVALDADRRPLAVTKQQTPEQHA